MKFGEIKAIYQAVYLEQKRRHEAEEWPDRPESLAAVVDWCVRTAEDAARAGQTVADISYAIRNACGAAPDDHDMIGDLDFTDICVHILFDKLTQLGFTPRIVIDTGGEIARRNLISMAITGWAD